MSRTAGLLLGVLMALALLLASLPAAAGPRWFENRATVRFAERNVAGQVRSNELRVQLPARPTSIGFFTDASYERNDDVTGLGQRLFVQVTSDLCDDTMVGGRLSAHLHSDRLNTDVQVWLDETAPGSGVFRAAADLAAQQGNMTTHDDMLWAIVDGCGAVAMASIMVQPGGVVFDSSTLAPLAGMQVVLVDAAAPATAGVPAGPTTLAVADAANNPYVAITNAEGRYRFESLPAPGRYRLVVTPAEGWAFPSTLPAGQLQAEHRVDASSFGAAFDVTSWGAHVLADVPVDPLSRLLRVQLDVSRNTPEIAESLVYTATLRNAGQAALAQITLAGSLPPGFGYVPGSARLNGQPLADPAVAPGNRGPALRFVLPGLAAGAAASLSYRVLVGPAALHGDGMHRIQARAALPATTLSNVASAKVEVQAGVFSDQAVLLGTVFADCDANGVQDAGEPGVPGVRVLLQNGSFAITDAQGHYSFYGLRPRSHVVKLDATSLPEGSTPLATSSRHAGDGGSRFVDPRRGQLVRADFALGGCSPAQHAQLQQRGARQLRDRELELTTHTELTSGSSPRSTGDRRALDASGVIGERAAAAGAARKAAAAATATVVAAEANANTAEAGATADDQSLEGLAQRSDATLAFIDLQDGQRVAGGPLLLRVKGRAGSRMTLEVNGKAIGDDRIGERVVVPDTQVELREYVGVDLRPGSNTLVLTEHDGFGNARGRRSVDVRAPGALARLRIELPAGPAAGDGETPVLVTVSLLDADGAPVTGRTAVTLETSLGEWDLRDNDPLLPGVQTFIDGGTARLSLRPPKTAGDAVLRISAGAVHEEATLRFTPGLRPLVAAGLVEGVFKLRSLRPGTAAATPSDGFDAALAAAAARSEQERNGVRSAVFAKGRVGDDTLLTLGYESDKDKRERLFRDIQPDAFYPVYGDDALKGFDAQSTSRLYVRADRGTASALYGDFSTQTANPLRQLGAYQRSLTGARVTQSGGPVTGSVWAARDTARQQVLEQAGNGTSGPFDIGFGVLPNSDRVEILVRDRNQPSLVLRSTPLARFSDYDIDALTGRLLLRAPLPSLDPDLNPVSLRITAEVDQGGAAFWVLGGDVQMKVNDSVSIGAAAAQDHNPLDPLRLASANTSIKLAEHTTLVAETAHTSRPGGLLVNGNGDAKGNGNAHRVDIVHEGSALRGRAYALHSDGNFSNPSAGASAGRNEAGVKGDYKLDERSRLLGEALRSEDLLTGSRRGGVLLGYERSFDGGMKTELGLRQVSSRGANAVQTAAQPAVQDSTTAVRAKLSTLVPALPGVSAFVEAEQDLQHSDKRMAAVGGDLQLAAGGRLYARHEFISSMTGPYALDSAQRRNSTLFGVDAAAPFDGRAFSEYRLREGLSGREAEAAIGLRNKWTLANGLHLNTSLERTETLQGTGANASAAGTAALEYTRSADFKASTRLELRQSTSTRSLLATLAAAWKLGSDWTMLTRAAKALDAPRNGQPEREQQRLQLGLAYRDGHSNRVNGLARYEFKRETGLGSGLGSATDQSARGAHIVSAHGDWQPQAALTLSGQVAAKAVREVNSGEALRSVVGLVGGRITRDLGERWDLGVHAHVLAGAGAGNSSAARSLGVEGGYRVQQNLWISVGFNASGFKDRDLGVEQHTERGAYVRLRLKFDEALFK